MNRIFKSVLLLAMPLMGIAAPVSSDEAAQAVRAWVGLRAQLGCRLGAAVSGARTCVPTNGVTFHVVKLEGGGFVVTSSDTETEPILAFSESDDFVESERNPLWTMLRRDLSACVLRRRQVQFAAAGASAAALSAPAAKWARLLPAKGTNGLTRVLQAATGKETLSDVRVAPLLQTKWNQEQDAYYSNMGDPCYNYYTPNNFPCGCVATATAQIMRYHRFPTASVTPGSYKCRVETGKDWITQTSYYPVYEDRTLTMQGGVYDWNAMPLVPADGTTLAQRQAIGKLTSDVGITCLMSYGEYGSSSGGYMAARSLPERFGYASAVAACGSFSVAFVRTALISNLDAKLPVMLGVSGGSGGHAVVADGYGYSLSTFYAHFNLGWGGRNDAWYAPPNVEDYNSVDSMVYNIYPNGAANGVICSGRVLSQSGTPVKSATVAVSGKASASAVTDANGVYAFILAPGSYEVSSGDASRSVTLVANVGTSVTDNGYYYSSPVAKVNNVCDLDLTVSGTVPPQEEDPQEEEPVVSGVRAGAWTTDVDAVRAASDCRMVVVLRANYGGCGWSQRAQPVFESKKFLDWAAENGVYLVTSDSSRLPTGCTDADDADSWFWTLYWSVSHPDGYVYWPTIAVVRPDNFTQAVGYDVVRDDGECTVGGLVYEGTADSLIAGLSAYVEGNPQEIEGESWTDPISGIVWIYSIDASGKVTLLGVSQSGRTLIVPEEVDGRSVVAIGDKAFAGLKAESVIVPGNIGSVGTNAFSNCTSLVQVDFEGEPPSGLGAAGFPPTTLVRYNDAYEDAWVKALADAGLTNASSYHPLMGLDWEYEYCDGGVRISGIRDLWYHDYELGEVRIPSSFNGWPVTEVGGGIWGFSEYDNDFITAVTIPDGVQTIGDMAFDSCGLLTTARIPESVTRIGMQAFCSCTNLTNVTLPQRLQTIDTHAFSSCNSLSEVSIPASVSDIGNGAFVNCRNLASFEVEAGNPSYASVGGVLYDKNLRTLIQCPALVSSVEIPKTVKTIGTSAFFWCSKITSLHIPASVEEIGRFVGCDSLSELTVDAKSKCFSVRDGVLYDYGKKTLVCCLPTCKAVDIPQSVERLDGGAFLGCTNLLEIVLPTGLREIGVEAFEECRSLKSITIPPGVRDIPDMAFYNCRNLKEIQLRGDVTDIGRDAFHNCRSLESVTLPATVKHIGDSAFEWCESLALTFEGAPPQVDGTAASRWSGPFAGCQCGYYSACSGQWEAEIDEDGRWHGLNMLYAGSENPGNAAFNQGEVSAAKGGVFLLTVYGGSDESAASVKLNVAYGNAKAADLVLKNATVSGANGVEKTNLKFPLTLSWVQGDTEPKTIVIPVAAGKATDAPKFLTWNLTDAKGLALGETTSCLATIAAGAKWSGGDVYVMPTVAGAAGGKVSGGASVKPDKKGAYKAVTLKATPGKGYWFAGWYSADGEWASGDLSFKATPKGGAELEVYEARFVPAHSSLCGTYNGYVRVNLRGMTLVKDADTSKDVYGDCPIAVTLSSAGKLSGSATVAGNKVSFKCDGPDYVEIDEDGVTWANFMVMLDEKAMFGRANKEVAEIILSDSQFGTGVIARNVEGDYAPFGSPKSYADLMRDRSKDASVKARLKTLSGTYAGYASDSGGRVVPLSVVVDAAGKAKVAGKFHDGTALSASTVLGGYGEDLKGQHVTDWWSYGNVFLSVKSLGKGNLHLELSGFAFDGEDIPRLQFTEVRTTSYSPVSVAADDINLCDRVVSRFSSGCWFPADADPDFGVVRLMSGEDTIDILYASKNGKITGLGKALQSGFTVKFDAKTGLLTVTKGKTYTIQGVLGDYASGCYRAGRINKDGTCEPVGIEFTTLPTPEESFPWADNGFVLTLGQNSGEDLQPSVLSEDGPLALTVSGLPAGLNYDKKTGLVTGAPTKAGTFKVKVGYTYATRKITRTATLVVNPRPEGLPVGTYAGYATVYIDGAKEGQRVDCPFTATIDKNGALSGSITLFGKKATLKASGYDSGSAGSSIYTATLDLKAVDKAWGTAALSIWIEGDEMSANPSGPFGDGAIVNGVVAHRNQTKDTGYATRVAPYVGTYVAALSTAVDAARYGVTTLSVAVDKKGTAKLAGTFADGTAFSGSAPLVLSEGPDGELASVDVSVAPKSLAQGALRISLSFYEENGAVALTCSAIAAKYARTAGEYVESSLVCDSAYRYASLAWVDRSVNPNATCLSVRCEKGSFDEALFAW